MGKLVNPFASHAKDPQFEPGWNHFAQANILTKKSNYSNSIAIFESSFVAFGRFDLEHILKFGFVLSLSILYFSKLGIHAWMRLSKNSTRVAM